MTLVADVGLQRGPLDLDVPSPSPTARWWRCSGPTGRARHRCSVPSPGSTRWCGDGSSWVTVMDDPPAGVFVPAEARPIGLVFQDYLLFPHFSVRDNVAFGLRSQGRVENRPPIGWRRGGWNDSGLGDKAKERPDSAIRGEQHVPPSPGCWLPNPRSSSSTNPSPHSTSPGARTAPSRRPPPEDFPGARVLVTHDPVEAVVLADRIVVLEDGKIRQQGTADRNPPAPPVRLHRPPRRRQPSPGIGAGLTTSYWPGGVAVHLAEPGTPDGDVLALIQAPGGSPIPRHRPDGTPRNIWLSRRALGIEGETPIGSGSTSAGRSRWSPRSPPKRLPSSISCPAPACGLPVKATDIDVYPV